MTFLPMRLRIETDRLVLTPEEASDAEWFTELLNAPGGRTRSPLEGVLANDR